MAVDINYYLERKRDEFELLEPLKTEELYSAIPNNDLRYLFAYIHQALNRLFRFMYDKKASNGHYNADASRELLKIISLHKDMTSTLKDSPYSYTIHEDYATMLTICKEFLKESGGSEIPENLPHINIKDYEAIIFMNQTVRLRNPLAEDYSDLKLIGEGSYARVFSFYDKFYNHKYALKRAKKSLNEKELERFRKEYDVLAELSSPYILEVYSYDSEKNEYIMEYLDETIEKYISNNNTKITLQQRKGIARQIFKGFKYIHDKDYLHRDLSYSNILLKHYDDGTNVVKISDFGLVKDPNSRMTSTESEKKGSLNDSNLSIIGFKNYRIEHETYALTQLIFFVMTGKRNLDKASHKEQEFVQKGMLKELNERYHSVDELEQAFNYCWN